MGRALTRVVCKYPSIHFYFLYMLADKKIFQTFRNAAFCSTLPNYSEYLFYFLI